jgi:hypothetical protein
MLVKLAAGARILNPLSISATPRTYRRLPSSNSLLHRRNRSQPWIPCLSAPQHQDCEINPFLTYQGWRNKDLAEDACSLAHSYVAMRLFDWPRETLPENLPNRRIASDSELGDLCRAFMVHLPSDSVVVWHTKLLTNSRFIVAAES